MIYLLAAAAFVSTFLGGLLAIYLRDSLHLILGFSAGAVIGVAFFDLIPEALTLTGLTAEQTFGIIAIGFGLYLVLDRMIVLHHHHEGEDEHAQHGERGAWGAATLSLHSFLDGVGIGLAFQASPAIGFIVAAAVLAHDFSDGINTVGMVSRRGEAPRKAFGWLIVDALTPLFGIIAASFVRVNEAQLGMLLALFSGFFLYIGASELLPESHHQHPMRWTTIATVLGMATMYLVIGAAGA